MIAAGSPDGLAQGIRHYCYEVDEKLGGLRKDPMHHQHSHAAEEFRTAAAMIGDLEPKKEQDKRWSFSKLSPRS